MDTEQNVFFSIVVPVYNVEEYLRQCVESVLHQTFVNYELILVDDGSPDNSGDLCDILAEEDPRIRVLHQENQGLSGARNSGLKLARGEYVLFLDSDDFYPQDTFLQGVYDRCASRDMVCFNYARYTDKLLKNMIAFPQSEGMSDEQLLLEMVKNNAYSSSACLKAVKRTLLQSQEITFEVGVLSEDIEWSARILSAAKGIAIAPECVYAYRVRQGSISKSVSLRHVQMQYKIVNKLLKIPVEEKRTEAYHGFVAFQYATMMINARLSKPRIDRELLGKIKEMAWLLEYDLTSIVRLIHTVYKLLGFEITSWLLLIYFKLFCK